MSVPAMIWAWKVRDIRPAEKLVLLHLADRHNEARGYAWPEYEDFVERTGLSLRSVQRHVVALEAKGLLSREPNLSKWGRKVGNRYYLDFGYGTPLALPRFESDVAA